MGKDMGRACRFGTFRRLSGGLGRVVDGLGGWTYRSGRRFIATAEDGLKQFGHGAGLGRDRGSQGSQNEQWKQHAHGRSHPIGSVGSMKY
ncbi:hypothetical protein MTBUT4_200007 [Magnetospirillum sp. UT-4]|nr:hypothetical protein MTBUT4_200007 [Magnetospirillum sp. UT-4]